VPLSAVARQFGGLIGDGGEGGGGEGGGGEGGGPPGGAK